MDIVVRKSEVNGVVRAPPSKSYTHRSVFAGALSKSSEIVNPLISDDTLATLRSCVKSGSKFVRYRNSLFLGGLSRVAGYYNCMNSGTTLRILVSLAALGERAILDGDESLRRRPNFELCEALKKLGAKVVGVGKDCRPPLKVYGKIKPGDVEIVARSSQFVTSLLFALPLVGDSVLKVVGVKSKPYIDVTLHVLEESGVKVEREGNEFFVYESDFRLRKFFVPPDFTSMSYLIAAGVLAGKVVIEGVRDSRQGDKIIVNVVRQMGGEVVWKGEKIIAERSELTGIDFDASDNPDLVPTIAVLGAVANGTTRIYNAEHLRAKETDRIRSICTNLRRLGVEVREMDDGLVVKGGTLKKGAVESFGDHRIAMAFSLLGLVGEISVRNADCVSVSYPKFFEDLKKLGADVHVG